MKTLPADPNALLLKKIISQPDTFIPVHQHEGMRQRVAAISSRLETHHKLEEEQAYDWPAVLLSHRGQYPLAVREQREMQANFQCTNVTCSDLGRTEEAYL